PERHPPRTPHASRPCWGTAGRTSPGWPRCSSTPAPRSTSRASPTRTRAASRGHARWCGRGRVAKRWNGCAVRLIPPDDAHDDALTPDLQHVTAAAAGYQLVGHRDGVAATHRLDRLAGRDQSVQRQLAGPGLTARRHEFDAATLVVCSADVALALEVGEVLVHRGERAERETLRDLLETRRISVGGDLPGNEIENLALTAGERHNVSRT